MNVKRAITLRLLQLIRDMTNKAAELEGVGIKLVLTDELIEQVASAMFEVNDILPEAIGDLYFSLADYVAGDIQESDFISLIDSSSEYEVTEKVW